MAAKRTIQFTAPDGQPLSVNVGPKRKVSAIRVLDFTGEAGDSNWLISIHGTVQAALTGPNQTPMWNRFPRHVLIIGEDDQPTADGWYAVPR